MYYRDKDGKVGRTNEFGVFIGLTIAAAIAGLFFLCAAAGLFR